MAFPRVPKLTQREVDWSPAELFPGPDHPHDPFGLGPSAPWLHLDNRRHPNVLERTDRSGAVHAVGAGVWAIHGFRGPDTALVSRDLVELLELDRDGTEQTLWSGPALEMVHGGARWGDNWMFDAAALPDGRLLLLHPDCSDPDGDPGRWPLQLVLRAASGETLDRLVLPERSASLAKRQGLPLRFTPQAVVAGCQGRVVILPQTSMLAVGVYEDRLKWIGTGTMPRRGDGIRSDGEHVRVSSDLSVGKVRWYELEGLLALWEAGR